MLLVLIFTFVQFAVTALVLARGGRYERYGALIVLVGTVVAQLTQVTFTGEVRREVLYVIDIGMCVAAAWLLWRHPAVWTGALAAVESTSVLLGVVYFLRVGQPEPEVLKALWWAMSVLAYLQLPILTLAVLRREFGPPHPLPAFRGAR